MDQHKIVIVMLFIDFFCRGFNFLIVDLILFFFFLLWNSKNDFCKEKSLSAFSEHILLDNCVHGFVNKPSPNCNLFILPVHTDQ